MKIIARPRQTGRTDELIRLSEAADNAGEVCYIVCHSQQEAYRIAKRANEIGCKIRFPISYKELPIRNGSFCTCICIDNVEKLIENITRRRVEAMVITTEEEEEEK
jgi:hypothetical protein